MQDDWIDYTKTKTFVGKYNFGVKVTERNGKDDETFKTTLNMFLKVDVYE